MIRKKDSVTNLSQLKKYKIMKKTTLILLALIMIKQSFAQTTLTVLPTTSVKSHRVSPVKFNGTDDYFYFEGFGGRKTGCFKINIGSIDYTKCDKFTFEFAEFYNGDVNLPLYFIKRTDGNYLSFLLGGTAFVPKHQTINNLRYQKWLISKEISRFPPHYTNSYFFILPLAPFEFGYTLKVFNNNKEIGCTPNLRIRPSESEFYLGQTPIKTFNGGPQHK